MNFDDLNNQDADLQGQLFVSVKECRKLPPRGNGVYCILQLEKQQVQTHGVAQPRNPDTVMEAWDEGFTFDVTNQSSYLIVSVLSTNQITPRGQPVDNSDGKFIGQLLIPMIAVRHEKPIDQIFKLSGYRTDDDLTGEIHLKLHYTSVVKRVGPEDFKPLKVVGRGSFAKVMMVQKTDTGRIYAMKVINKDAVIKHNAVKHTMSERNVLKRINHPFIVSLKYSFQTEDKLYMILDFINGGELFFHLSEAERFEEERARFYAAEITCALGYLHKMDVAYRDLKPENLLLDMDGHICLTDFGLCKEGLGYGSVTHTFCGSPEYLAPEIFLGTGYDKSVDWWALGTLLYEMLSGLPPFFSEDLEEMNLKILTEPLQFPDYFSEDAKSVLSKLLDRNPKRRLGASLKDAEEVKAHPFFKSIDWGKLERKRMDPNFRPALRNEFDVRFFDPEATQEVAKLSFSKTQLTSKEQEAFRGFSFVAPDAIEMIKRSRRRGSSGSSGKASPKFSGSPVSPIIRKTTPTFPEDDQVRSRSPLANVVQIEEPAPMQVEKPSSPKSDASFLSSHRIQMHEHAMMMMKVTTLILN